MRDGANAIDAVAKSGAATTTAQSARQSSVHITIAFAAQGWYSVAPTRVVTGKQGEGSAVRTGAIVAVIMCVLAQAAPLGGALSFTAAAPNIVVMLAGSGGLPHRQRKGPDACQETVDAS